MRFSRTSLEGLIVIDLEPASDNRGWFARTWCEKEFLAQGLNTHWPQANQTHTLRRGMVRGMHWQADPHPEVKLVRCSAGAIWDVAVDVRKGSPTFGRWEAFELTSSNFRQLYIPAGYAHGFQCLQDGSEVSYLMGDSYCPEAARGFRWDDPAVDIRWPEPDIAILSERDRSLPDLVHA